MARIKCTSIRYMFYYQNKQSGIKHHYACLQLSWFSLEDHSNRSFQITII